MSLEPRFECSAIVLGRAKGADGSRVTLTDCDGRLEASAVRLGDGAERKTVIFDPAASARAVMCGMVALFAFAVGDPVAQATYDALTKAPPAVHHPLQSSPSSE